MAVSVQQLADRTWMVLAGGGGQEITVWIITADREAGNFRVGEPIRCRQWTEPKSSSAEPSKLEQAAKAMWERRQEPNAPEAIPWSTCHETVRAEWIDDTRAAIGALKNPDSQVCAAGAAAVPMVASAECGKIFDAMLSAILAEKPE